MEKPRCEWCLSDAHYLVYHDTQWGVPVKNDNILFEFLILESMQAGLNWLTILKKREALRVAFDHFNAEKIAGYTSKKIAQLMTNPEIIRHRLKIEATIKNARAFLAIQEKSLSFKHYLWQFAPSNPHRGWKNITDIPSQTSHSIALAKALKQQGFIFLGPTICYAYMQAIGMVNDHIARCFRYKELTESSCAIRSSK